MTQHTEQLAITRHQSMQDVPPALLENYRTCIGDFAASLARPDFYRARLSRSAIEVSRSMQEAVRQAPVETPRTALVLGASMCAEISLSELAHTYDTIDLVDVDTVPAQAAVTSLPPSLRTKFSIIQADITGSSAPFASLVQAASKGSPKDLEQTIAGGLPAMNRQSILDEATPYTFVVAQSVISELAVAPMRFLDDQLRQEAEYGIPEVGSGLQSALKKYRAALQYRAITQIGRLTAERGMAHFSDGMYRQAELTEPHLATNVLSSIHESFVQIRPAAAWDVPHKDGNVLMLSRGFRRP